MDKVIEGFRAWGIQPCLYILRLPQIRLGKNDLDHLYKFGITDKIGDRLQTHSRNLNFEAVILVKKFPTRLDAVRVEKQIKRLSESREERRNLLGNTEILQTTDLSVYIDLIYVPQFIDLTVDETASIESIDDTVEDTSNDDVKDDVTINVNGWKIVAERIPPADGKFSCQYCGKKFADNKDLNRHKNRKVPCFTHEVTQEQLQNPNKCIHCNRPFAKHSNMVRHLSTCKFNK